MGDTVPLSQEFFCQMLLVPRAEVTIMKTQLFFHPVPTVVVHPPSQMLGEIDPRLLGPLWPLARYREQGPLSGTSNQSTDVYPTCVLSVLLYRSETWTHLNNNSHEAPGCRFESKYFCFQPKDFTENSVQFQGLSSNQNLKA